jgi:uncharacterized RDD family membrane protein YckC
MQITITTANNVELQYDVASVGDRVVSGIIDGLIQFSYVVLVSLVDGWVDLGLTVVVILFLPFVLYHLLCEILLDGRSFGKMAVGLQVAKLDGTEPTVGSYLLRWIVLPIDSLFLVGLLVLVINGKGQRLGDLAAGTTVIKVRRRMRLEEALLPRLAAEYTPTYPQVLRLSDRDVAIIRDVWSAGTAQSSRRTLTALAEHVAAVMGVDSAATRSPQEFLSTVLRDHTYLTQGTEPV